MTMQIRSTLSANGNSCHGHLNLVPNALLPLEFRATRFSLLVVACLALNACGARQPTHEGSAAPAESASSAAYRQLLSELASDAYEGRGVLTPGNAKAATRLSKAFADAGLEPAGQAGWLSCFDQPVETSVERLNLKQHGMLGADGKPSTRSPPIEDDQLGTTPYSASGAFSGALLFLGYGIDAPDAGYSDYSGDEAKDKVLMILRYEPRERDPKSPLNGARPSRYSSMRRKVYEAKRHGAKAVLFVSPPRPGDTPDKKVARISPREAQSSAGIPVLQLLPSVADFLLRQQGTSLAAEVEAIDRDFKSRSIDLGEASGEVQLKRTTRKLCNVVGRLPGTGPLAKESLVLGAHFDHLGYGQSGSMAPGVHAIHNGADDNASGAAALSVLAARLRTSLPKDSHRSLIFVAFNGEEIGLAGSSHYVEAPAAPLDTTRLMLNMDMIGRMKNDTLVVLGTESGSGIADWVAAASSAQSLSLQASGDGYGPSDQTPFYANDVPVLHFFTGAHEDYHRPSDDADKINWAGAEKVLQVVAAVATRAATTLDPIVYQESKRGPPISGDSRGYGAWLGTIPDYTAMSPSAAGGVKISGVSPKGPARAAGLQGGDVIVSMGGRKVDNLYDMTFVLRDHRPGDVIEVVVKRGGKRVTLAATLGDRAAHSGGGNAHGVPSHGAHKGPGSDSHAKGPQAAPPPGPAMDPKTLLYPGEERHLKNLRQLTFEGENAEAYFSPDGKSVVYQARGGKVACDRIYTLDIEHDVRRQISSGKGRTTCAFYTFPEGGDILFASTKGGGPECPPEPDHSHGYVWALYDSFDLYLRHPNGRIDPLLIEPGYDAEATVCFKTGETVFTSTRDGDIELYSFKLSDKHPKPRRLTHTPGYDGGAFFSPDCSKLVWRASRPKGEDLKAYQALLAQGLVHPSHMELQVAKADGSQARQITHNGAANFAPYFMPDNRHILYASNVADPSKRNFDLHMIDPEAGGGDPEAIAKSDQQITFSPVFEAFPMFSPDGRHLMFSSNRNACKKGETNLFFADWIE